MSRVCTTFLLVVILDRLRVSGHDPTQLLLQAVVGVFPSDSGQLGRHEREAVCEGGEESEHGEDLRVSRAMSMEESLQRTPAAALGPETAW